MSNNYILIKKPRWLTRTVIGVTFFVITAYILFENYWIFPWIWYELKELIP